IYKPINKKIKLASFEVSINNNIEVILAIKSYLKINNNIYINEFNNSKITLKSINDIKNVVIFINNNPIKLLGYKKLQYLLFLKDLRLILK
ncbi:hypothetical protein NE645_17275, partial [Roseburia hominis]|nr:hypothetical protein [Roseburia hominis]